MSDRIVLEKENFKFSAAHFTVFGAHEAERLHGHNYYVVVELRLNSMDPRLGMAFDFNLVKPLIREITESYDEYVLMPERSPFLEISRDDARSQIRVRHAEKEYAFPATDVRLLPVVNVTSEELARVITNDLLARLKSRAPQAIARLRSIAVGVQETRGQTVFVETALDGHQ